VAEALIEGYILCIHDRAHSIFHIPTLRSAVRQKQLNHGTYCALLSYGARLSSDKSIAVLAKPLFERSREYFHSDLENVCLENIQTSILLAHLSAASLRSALEALYLGIAIRMAEMLSLNVSQRGEPIMIHELKRRIWWTLFMADRWCSAGNGLRRQMQDFDRAVELPMDEAVFHQHADIQLNASHQRPKPGLWAHMITLAEIFGPIQDLNRQVARQVLSEDETQNAVLCLNRALETWEATLPDDVKYSLPNLYSYRSKGLGGPFVALHLGYNHYGTILLYQYLDNNRIPNSLTRELAQRCKQYAKNQCALLRTAKDLGKCETVYPGVGHNAAISSSVLLHILLFGDEGEFEEARRGLQSNLEILKDLSRYWPSLELIVRPLAVFQETCLQRAAARSFNFDDWLVKFLLEYHLPLNDKGNGERYQDEQDPQTHVSLQGRVDVGTSLLRAFWEQSEI
jgi:hypothetical protein